MGCHFSFFIILTEKTPSSKRSEGGGSSIRENCTKQAVDILKICISFIFALSEAR